MKKFPDTKATCCEVIERFLYYQYLADRIFGFLGRDPALAEHDDPVGRDAAGLVAPDVLAPVLQPLHGHLVPGPAVNSLLPLLTTNLHLVQVNVLLLNSVH